MKPIPILFLSDSAEISSGLARIARDLATLTSSLPEFRVGYLGRGGHGSRSLPFTQYNFPERLQWGESILPEVWEDFSPNERGIIFTNWDISRLTWLGLPDYLPNGRLKDLIQSRRFQRWGYFPIDAEVVGGRVTALSVGTVMGFDRILTPTRWAKGVIDNSIPPGKDVDWIPHGVNLTKFRPYEKIQARREVLPELCDGDIVIGAVATNQARKDWGLMGAVCAEVKKSVRGVKFWWHVDTLSRYWSIPAILTDFGLNDDVLVTDERLSDEQMAKGYSACDLTLHPGLGEGFGFPIAESLACGVPAIHGDYAGGAELIQEEKWKVRPVSWRVETLSNCVRPVFEPFEWARAIRGVLESPPRAEECRAMVEHLGWNKLWNIWRRWFLKGIQ